MGILSTRAWFEEGRWPIQRRDEVSHHHFEDLRKRLFVARNWGCGTDTNWLATVHPGGEAPAQGHATDTLYEEGALTIPYNGEIWTNASRITQGFWELIPMPPFEYHRPVRIKVGNNIYKVKKRHIASGDFQTELDNQLWEFEGVSWNVNMSYVGEGWTGGNGSHTMGKQDHPYYTIPEWTAGTFYQLNEWVTGNGTWVLAAFKGLNHRYHDFDKRVPRVIKDFAYLLSDQENWTRYSLQAHQSLPVQTDAVAWERPIKFKDTGRVKWVYGSKVGFNAKHITDPYLAGARIRRGLTDVTCGAIGAIWKTCAEEFKVAGVTPETYPTYQMSNYANDEYVAPDFFTGNMNRGQNPKCSESYQSQIEMQCDMVEFHIEADQTYRDNWEAFYGEDFDSFNFDGFKDYPSITDHLWGENGSGFELLKAKSGEYDWYWCNDIPYYPYNYMVAKEHPVDTGVSLPCVAGTWRRFWKYSLGRPCLSGGTPYFMRAYEKGDPRTNNNYPTPSPRTNPERIDCHAPNGYQTCNVFWPTKTFCQSVPTISEFVSWTFTISGVDSNSFAVAGDKRTELKVGALIYIGTGTSISGYVHASVLCCTYDIANDVTIAKVTQDCSSYDGASVCGDTHLTERHDPVGFDEDENPMYELKHELVNEMRNVLLSLTAIPTRVTTETRNATAYARIYRRQPNVYEEALTFCLSIRQNPDEWLSENDVHVNETDWYIDYDYEVEHMYVEHVTLYGPDFFVYDGKGEHWDYNVYPEVFVKYYQGSVSIRHEAIRFIRPANNEYLKNVSQIICRFSASSFHPEDVAPPGYGYPESTCGLSPPTETPSRYYYKDCIAPLVNQSSSGGWVKFSPEVGPKFVPPTSTSSEYDGSWFSAQSGQGFLNNFVCNTDVIIIVIDYNAVAEAVFKRDSNLPRDFWGYHVVEEDWGPLDTLAPIPNPSVWQVPPYAEFKYTKVTAPLITISGYLSNGELYFTSSGNSLASGELIEFCGESIPGGTSRNKVYVAQAGSGQLLFTVKELVDFVLQTVTVTSGGSRIRRCSHTDLLIKSEIVPGQDIDNHSLPLHRRMVGIGGGAWTTEYAEAWKISIPQRYLHNKEAFFTGAYALVNGLTAVSGGGVLVVYAEVPSGWVQPDEYFFAKVFLLGFDEAQSDKPLTVVKVEAVQGQTYKKITLILNIAVGNYTQDSSLHFIRRTDETFGYQSTDWDNEPCHDYSWKPQTRDDASPTNNMTKMEGAVEADLLAPTEFPCELISQP